MTTFVLVHGAFGSSAELAPVIPELEALGHRAIAVDLPCTDPAATLDDYARTVVATMAGIAGPVVVVGHSAGGATISLVPARTRVDRLVYVTAVVPEPGRSIVDAAGGRAYSKSSASAVIYRSILFAIGSAQLTAIDGLYLSPEGWMPEAVR